MPINDKLASEQWYRYRWCVDRGHYEFLEKAQRCEDFTAGLQWNSSDLNKLKLQRRPALTINKIISTVSTILGEQIYNRNEVLYRPSHGATVEVAEALSKVFLQIAQNNQLNWTRSDVFCDGIIRSRGFYDVRLDFDDAMRGEIRIDLCNSKNVVIDPDGEKYDPDEWNDVFITKWLTWQDVAILFNEDDAQYLRGREISMFPYSYDSIERVRDRFAGSYLQGTYYNYRDDVGVRRNIRTIERQYHVLTTQKHFVDTVTGDTRPIPEGWNRDKIAGVLQKAGDNISVIDRRVKRIRWTVTADHVVLHDDWSPYKHFTVVPYFPFFRHGRSLGIVEHLISSQELLNKTSSQELHIVNTTANSGWKLKAGSLKNMSVEELKVSGSQTGLVLELENPSDAEKIQPNQTPVGLDRISFKAEEHIKTISGVSDSMQGFDREDVAAKAIIYKQQRGGVNLTKVLDNLERTDYILARNVLDLIQGYYTEERLIHITGEDSRREPETIQVNQVTPEGEIINDLTLGEYSIVVTSSPYRATMEDSQFEQALGLRKEGVAIPDKFIIESSRLPRRSDIIREMEAQANSQQAQQNNELDMRAKAANVEKLEGEAKEKHTKAALELSRAQKEQADMQSAGGMAESPEIMKLRLEEAKMQQQFALEQQKLEQEFTLKREQLAQEMALKREAHDQEMAMKQEEARQKQESAAQEQMLARQQHYAERLKNMVKVKAKTATTEEK